MRIERDPHDISDRLDVAGLLEIAEDIVREHGVTLAKAFSQDRHKSITRARHAIWYAIRHHPERHYSYPEIAEMFGRDHTTVMSGIAAHHKRTGGKLPDFGIQREKIDMLAAGW